MYNQSLYLQYVGADLLAIDGVDPVDSIASDSQSRGYFSKGTSLLLILLLMLSFLILLLFFMLFLLLVLLHILLLRLPLSLHLLPCPFLTVFVFHFTFLICSLITFSDISWFGFRCGCSVQSRSECRLSAALPPPL